MTDHNWISIMLVYLIEWPLIKARTARRLAVMTLCHLHAANTIQHSGLCLFSLTLLWMFVHCCLFPFRAPTNPFPSFPFTSNSSPQDLNFPCTVQFKIYTTRRVSSRVPLWCTYQIGGKVWGTLVLDSIKLLLHRPLYFTFQPIQKKP